MKKRRILISGEAHPYTGGIATVIQDQFASSLSCSFELILFDTRKRTRKNRTFVEGVLAQCGLIVVYLIKLLALRPDVVHIHAGGGSDIFRKGLDVLIAIICRRRVVLHIHGGDFDQFFSEGNERNLKRIQRIFQKCTRIIALSDYWRLLYKRIVVGDRISVVNNSVNIALYNSMNREVARKALGIADDVMVILHLGSQGARKGTFDLIRALALVNAAEPNVVAILVGPDEDVHPGAIEQGNSLAERLGISSTVRFLGAQTGTKKVQCLAAADLFVMPSYSENFPISILEAMACRLPVISTKVGGIPEILCESHHEDLIEPGEVGALADRIMNYVRNPNLRQELGLRNRIAAEKRFNLELFAKNLAKIYNEVCGAA